jgi:hypothetical protein
VLGVELYSQTYRKTWETWERGFEDHQVICGLNHEERQEGGGGKD